MSREITLEPTIMIEELMWWIHQNEMGGDFMDPSNRWFPLYLELQKLLDNEQQKKYDLYVSVNADETK